MFQINVDTKEPFLINNKEKSENYYDYLKTFTSSFIICNNNKKLMSGGGTSGISGWGCAARTLEPLALYQS